MRVGEEALGHAHGEERSAALLHEVFDLLIGLSVSRSLAENDEGTLGAFEHVECPLDGVRRRDLGGRGIDNFDERFLAGLGVYRLSEELCRKIEIDAAGTAR